MASPAKRILRSFGYAANGVALVLRTQPNAWVHIFLAFVALLLCAALGTSPAETAVVVLTIGTVLALEALNTAVEALADRVSPEHDPLIKTAKDAAAGGVLLGAIAALGVAAVVFLPRLIALLSAR